MCGEVVAEVLRSACTACLYEAVRGWVRVLGGCRVQTVATRMNRWCLFHTIFVPGDGYGGAGSDTGSEDRERHHTVYRTVVADPDQFNKYVNCSFHGIIM